MALYSSTPKKCDSIFFDLMREFFHYFVSLFIEALELHDAHKGVNLPLLNYNQTKGEVFL